MEIMYTVNPGIEDVAAEEITAEMGGKVEYEVLTGHVLHVTDRVDFESLLRLRSINKAFILLYKDTIGRRFEDLIEFREKLSRSLIESSLNEFLTPLSSFAVETERIGEHEFTSIDVSRIVGDVVIKTLTEKRGFRPRVDLRKPSTIIHVFVREQRVFIGVSLTGQASLHRRGYRIYDHPAALKPPLAYAMLTLSGTKDGDVIADPMCGGGTISIEARLIHEDAAVYCMDINKQYVEMAQKNALAAGVFSLISFMVWDARRIDEAPIPEIDHIVSNPPYGIRYGDLRVVRKLYETFLERAYNKLSDGGRLTLITTEYNFIKKKLSKLKYIKVHERVVKHGGLYPHIVVLEK